MVRSAQFGVGMLLGRADNMVGDDSPGARGSATAALPNSPPDDDGVALPNSPCGSATRDSATRDSGARDSGACGSGIGG